MRISDSRKHFCYKYDCENVVKIYDSYFLLRNFQMEKWMFVKIFSILLNVSFFVGFYLYFQVLCQLFYMYVIEYLEDDHVIFVTNIVLKNSLFEISNYLIT